VYAEIFGPLDLVDAGDTAERAVEAANPPRTGLTSSILSCA
jgi:acyl-CoA reductase-like NAD-dependent aldehyde dehydrogenase